MSEWDEAKFCECEHSMYDHAMPKQGPIGACFVGGCECIEYSVDVPSNGFRSGLSSEGSWGFQ